MLLSAGSIGTEVKSEVTSYVVTHMKFRAKPGNFISLSYIGQSDLHITYGLLCVWYTPGGQWV